MLKLRRIVVFTTALCLLVSGLSLSASALNERWTLSVTYRDIKIVVNGVAITPRDAAGTFVEPFINGGTTYLPVRAVAEAFGKDVAWDGDTGTVTITGKPGTPAAPAPGEGTKGTHARKSLTVTYRDVKLVIDGIPITPKDAAGNIVEPFISGGTTYLPVRAVAEALGKDVAWDGDTGTVTVTDPVITEVTVSTAAEFVAALGPNKTILLKAGVYNLSAAGLREIKNANVIWTEEFDGWQMRIVDVRNLTVRGLGDTPPELIVDPRYALALCFVDSRNISIDNIKAGHSEGGYCTGGVIGLTNCTGVAIDKTQMYGCGAMGLDLNNVSGMAVRDSSIYDCTYAIMYVADSDHLVFENCLFRDNQEYDLVRIARSQDITISGCEFRNNRTLHDYSFFVTEESGGIVVKNSKFIDNTAPALGGDFMVEFVDCAFTGNSFAAP